VEGKIKSWREWDSCVNLVKRGVKIELFFLDYPDSLTQSPVSRIVSKLKRSAQRLSFAVTAIHSFIVQWSTCQTEDARIVFLFQTEGVFSICSFREWWIIMDEIKYPKYHFHQKLRADIS